MIERVESLKRKLGDELLILAHYYQNKAVQDASHMVGDSYKLSVAAKKAKARYIVFCGVRFMAETAAILARDSQHVLIPTPTAECEMATMTDGPLLYRLYEENKTLRDHFVPVVYVNTTAEVKAFAGKYNGVACTSSNARIIISSLLKKHHGVFFIPDKNLGMNAARLLDIPSEAVAVIGKKGERPSTLIKEATRFCVWDGYCPVHHSITVEHIQEAKAAFPDAHIIVHPECRPEVVRLSDYAGSTSQLLSYIKKSASNSPIIIGTEYNFVETMKQHYPDKKIHHLKATQCVDMHAGTLPRLAATVESIQDGPLRNEVRLDPAVITEAKKPINEMIRITEAQKSDDGGGA